jgi:hypothetical protein
VHAFAYRQRPLGQFVQRATDGVVRLGGGVRAAHLAEHLLLTDHRRVQPAGHREQVLDGGLGVPDVGVFGEVVQRHSGPFGQHLADHRQAAVERVDDRVDLDPVAGGQHHGLGHQRGLQQLVDELCLIGLIRTQLLQDRDGRTAVRNSEQQHAHGFITTSTKVMVLPPGHQISRRSKPLTRSRPQVGPQSLLIDLPVAVFGAVEQHHRQPVAELCAQRRAARRRGRVDIGHGQAEIQFGGQRPQLVRSTYTQAAAVARQQLDGVLIHDTSIRRG